MNKLYQYIDEQASSQKQRYGMTSQNNDELWPRGLNLFGLSSSPLSPAPFQFSTHSKQIPVNFL